MTMTDLVWNIDDGSCNMVVTVRKNGGDTSLTCTATSGDSIDDFCQDSTDVTFAVGDLFAVELAETSGCNNSDESVIIVSYTVP
jgi:hypothetical protein